MLVEENTESGWYTFKKQKRRNAVLVIFYLKIFGDLRNLLYLCIQKINEGPASDEFSLVGDGTFFMSENIELTNKILTQKQMTYESK